MFIHSSGFWIPAWYFLFYHPSLCRALYNNAHILRYRVVFASVLAREKVGHRQPNLKLNLVQQQAFFSTTVGKDWIRTDTLHILPHTETRANNEQQKTWKQTDTVATSSSMFMVGWRTRSRLPYCFACSFPILPFFYPFFMWTLLLGCSFRPFRFIMSIVSSTLQHKRYTLTHKHSQTMVLFRSFVFDPSFTGNRKHKVTRGGKLIPKKAQHRRPGEPFKRGWVQLIFVEIVFAHQTERCD